MKQLDFSSLRVRLLLLVILAGVPALLLPVYTATEQRAAARARIESEALQLSRLTAAAQEEWLEGSRQLLVALGNLPAVRDRNPAACSEFLAQIRKNYPLYANLFAATPEGDLFCSAISMKQPVNSADLAWFKRAVSSRDFAVGDYQAVGRITGVAVIVAAYPVYDGQGRLQAVVCASLDLSWLNAQAKNLQLSPNNTFRVIDRNGTILARYPDPEKWVGRRLPDAGIIKTILSRREGLAEAPGVDNITRIFAFFPVHSRAAETGIYVSVGIPKAVYFDEINRILRRNFFGLGLVTLFMLLIFWLASDFFVLRNVNALIIATRRLAAGDLSARTGLSYDRGEVGELARVFDEMAGSLEARETERKRAEEVLQESETKFHAVIEASPVPFALNDERQNITYLNAAFITTFGYDLGDIPTLADWWPRAYPDIEYRQWVATTWQAHLNKAKQAGTPFEPMELNIRCKDGTLRNAIVHAVSLGEAFQGIHLVIFYDISERKKAEEELQKQHDNLEELVKDRTAALRDSQLALMSIVEDVNQKTVELETANDKLQELDRLKSMFIASMSHELRTPLNSIIGFSGILLMGLAGELNSEQKGQIERVSHAGKHLLSLIADIIDIAKIESGKIQAFAEDFLLREVVVEACESLKVQIHDKGLELRAELPSTPVAMKTDRRRLLQCLLNYLGNAVKFTEKGSITVAAREEDGRVAVSVSDTGIGIKAADMGLLFTSFVRLDSPLKMTTTGTGLGLYLTKKLVTEVLGGEVFAASTEGVGSTFSMTIPRALPDQEQIG